MSSIDRRLATRTRKTSSQAESPLQRFLIARQAMHHAFLSWLRTGPAPADVEAELAAMQSVMQQLASLALAGGLS
jgi:hypothetical protein